MGHQKITLGSISQNSISAKKFSDKFSSQNYVEISTQKTDLNLSEAGF
jgi:hypothetical protein